MTSIIAFLITRGVPARFARPLIYIVGALLLIAVLAVGKCTYDQSVIEQHEAETRARVAEQARTASENATAKGDIAKDAFDRSQAAISKGINDAANDPASQNVVGPASRAYYERLRACQADSSAC